MPDVFEGLKPELIWKHFGKILTIPRCSGQEKAIGDHILAFAKSCQLFAKRDSVGNVVVRKSATPGHENAAGVILQGHLDMVGEKNSDTIHDFSKDPIRARLKEGWVQAAGTTLGADNGIGIAACLAALEDTSLINGPIECLFTIDEERGLTGAKKIETSFLKGQRLLNLDSEDEGIFTIGCSGGADTEIKLPLKRKKTSLKDAFRLKLFGYRGGHSGLDINQGRGNAIKLLARIVDKAQRKYSFELIRIEGGNKRNAIAREAWADLYLKPAQVKGLTALIQAEFEKIRIEFRAVETAAAFSFDKLDKEKELALAETSQKQLISLLLGLPHGVLAMHQEIAGLVETSTNMAIVHCGKDKAQIICSSRSSLASALEAAKSMIRAITDLAGAKISQPQGYPGWAPNLESPLLKIFKDVYKREFGIEAKVVAVHAGLECGILGEKFPGMDMISFGPTLEHPHSPDERLNIDSVGKFWKLLTIILRDLA